MLTELGFVLLVASIIVNIALIVPLVLFFLFPKKATTGTFLENATLLAIVIAMYAGVGAFILFYVL